MSHTQGKLRIGKKYTTDIYADRAGHAIARTVNPQSAYEDEANARRLVACWNACEGIGTEDLEKGHVILTSSDFSKEKDHQKYALIKALKDIAVHEHGIHPSRMLAACAAIQSAEGL